MRYALSVLWNDSGVRLRGEKMSVCGGCFGDNIPEGCDKAHKTFRKTYRLQDGTVYEVCSKLHKSFKLEQVKAE